MIRFLYDIICKKTIEKEIFHSYAGYDDGTKEHY